jgi:hypothetical protein
VHKAVSSSAQRIAACMHGIGARRSTLAKAVNMCATLLLLASSHRGLKENNRLESDTGARTHGRSHASSVTDERARPSEEEDPFSLRVTNSALYPFEYEQHQKRSQVDGFFNPHLVGNKRRLHIHTMKVLQK